MWLWMWNGCWCQMGWSGYFKNCWSTGIFTHISRVYREWSEKEKISSERQLCGRKCLVDVRGQRRMGSLVRDDRKATVTQITTRYNQGMLNIISECTTRRTLKQMGYSSRRPHGCRSCQLRTGNGGYRPWKHGSILPCLNGSGWWWWWCGRYYIFLAHFGISTNWALFKRPTLPEYCCWPCPSLYDYTPPHPSSDGYFQQDNAPCHKTQIISDWLLEHDNLYC